MICKHPCPLQEGRECFALPIHSKEYPWQGCTCACPEPRGSRGQVEGRKGKVCWAVWSLLFVICSFFPKKPLKQASAEQLSQLQKCLEGGVVRGVWRREAGEINLAPTGKWIQTPAVCI